MSSGRVYTSMMAACGADSGMRRFVREYLPVRPGEHLLDLGCGPGRLYPHVREVDYCGVDVDAGYLARARALYPEARFEQHDLSTPCPAFDGGEYDWIVASAVFHHLPDDAVRRVLGFCRDRLRSGGRLIALDCAWEPGQGIVSRLLIAADRGHFVRSGTSYLGLAREQFQDARLTIRHDLLRVPYCHAIVECRK